MIGSDFLSSFTHIGIRWTQLVAATAFSLTGFVLRMALQTACRPHHGWHSGAMWCWEKFGRLNPLTNGAWKTVLMCKPWGKRNHKLTEGKVYHPFISIYGNIGDGLFFWVYHGISFYIFYVTFSSWGSQCELYRAEKPQRLSTSQASANMRPDIVWGEAGVVSEDTLRRNHLLGLKLEITIAQLSSGRMPALSGRKGLEMSGLILALASALFHTWYSLLLPESPSGPDRIQLTGRSHLFRLRVQGGILMGEAKPPASHHLGFWFWPPPKATGSRVAPYPLLHAGLRISSKRTDWNDQCKIIQAFKHSHHLGTTTKSIPTSGPSHLWFLNDPCGPAPWYQHDPGASQQPSCISWVVLIDLLLFLLVRFT